MKTLCLSPNALSGALNLDMLPGALQALSLGANNFTETTTLTSLNPTLRMLYLNRNTFEGSLNFTFPESLEGIYLSENLFSCEIDVSQLPEGLTELGAAHNRLVGSLCLTSLPQALDYLHLENNAFHGSLGFTRLPESLESLDLSDNSFSGEIDVSHLPAEMRELDVRNNKLCGNVHTPPGLVCWVDDTESKRLFDGNADLGVEDLGIYFD
ncbi:leucine-rich repeat protein [Perkinsela sp. CCAP 1560/4]|nr:leucine-rich repeat protein [Perkinsela sp. CCAP 1560/4]|eukprot:KNH05710.1 leucine-rich repeat protein [Perkinsela sp. CCAP 1560/4]